jgi:ribonuclease J
MQLRIHRGAEEIGGNCIELEADGKSILLDLGAPLMGKLKGAAAMPDVPGLQDGTNPDLLGIVISHPHADHYGLTALADPSIPIYIGKEADKLLRAAMAFGPFGAEFSNVNHYSAKHPIEIGPFKLTPYLVDHSAFDSYAFLIEANGKRLFYSGDLRGHGWKKWAFEALIKDAPKDVGSMLLEGTTLGRVDDKQTLSEADLVDPIVGHMKNTDGLILAGFSGQNIDRFVTFYKAALKSGRTFVVDLYIAHLLRAIDRKTLPDPTSSNLRVFLPHRTKMKIVRDKAFDLVEPFRDRRIYPNELRKRRKHLAMSFRQSMSEDLEQAGCLENAKVLYSMWPGYLERSRVDLRQWCKEQSIDFDIVHTSGHATPTDLKRLVTAINPVELIPIHTVAPDQFNSMAVNVKGIKNGQWINVR